MNRIFLFLFFLMSLVSSLLANDRQLESAYQNLEVIDIPTAEVVNHYGYHVLFRFGSEGALQNKTSFGVFPRLNIGFGLDGEHVLGTDDARMNRPTINIRFRLFDGKGALPALALGYDGQGYVYNQDLREYEQREKGVYLVSTKEFLLPNLMLHLGGNIFDFDEENSARAFAGFSYIYEQTIGLLLEWDHATEFVERRINFGLKYFITPVFTVDLIGRNIPQGLNTEDRQTERIVVLGYTGSF